jgi:hypothetical protein
MGVFATRSPNRPNPIGLSVVRLLAVEQDPALGPVLRIAGIDMTDNTPVYDIKPYLPFADAVPDAVGGYADALDGDRLTVEDPDDLLSLLPEEKRAPLVSVLCGDPRPSYRGRAENGTDGREYGFPYAGYEIAFCVTGTTATILKIRKK